MDQFVMQPGQGWMSRDAAKAAYGFTDKELQQVFRRLKPIGATCPRKGLSIDAIERLITDK